MKASVIIVNYNVKYFLELCLHSVYRAAGGMDIEVIVVDNNSKDGSCHMVRERFPQAILIENKDNKGFSKANNQAVAISQGEYILFLNPDTVMPEDFFKKTLIYMDNHADVGALGPRLIDGKGQFAPDSKKSFPSLSVALFKTTGINKVFSRSPFFNRYYAVHIKPDECAPVDVLSGCCMLVRRSAMHKAGGAFDEDYFMYCEDVDLSYRIQKAGFKNIYYPEAELIHYKGESTRKSTLSYVRVFNEALVTFVKKHYTKKQARLFTLFINIGIILRAIMGALKLVLKAMRMPLVDTLLLFITLLSLKDFWVVHVKNIPVIPLSSVYATFPVYLALWIISLYFNGAYDQPYRALRVMRGMLIGTVVILAYYGLLQPELRYSRAIIIFTGLVGTVILLGIHELLYRLGIIKLIPYDQIPRKAVIVAGEEKYANTILTLRHVHYSPEITGRISPIDDKGDALATLTDMQQLLYTAGIDEVIFCINGLTYNQVFEQMQHCGAEYDYKLHIPGSPSFIGSNSSQTAGDLYTIDRRYNLEQFGHLRNKRVVDIVSSILFLLLFPITLLLVKRPAQFVSNCFRVLMGKLTWIGYIETHNTHSYLPRLRKGVLPPYNVLDNYIPSATVKEQLDTTYAQGYKAITDVNLMLKNFKYLGGF